MKKFWRVVMTISLIVGLLPISAAAKHATSSFGLAKGNKTYEVPANTWVGTYVFNDAGNGTITKIQLLVDDKTPNGVVRMAIYRGTPCTILQDLGYAAVVNGWVIIDGLNIPVTEKTYYHLAFDFQSPNRVRADQKTKLGSYSAPWPYNADPFGRPESALDMPPGGNSSSVQYIIFATVVPD